ncbi:MAG: chloride channel protein [Lachnospiraceae bacterium]
MKRLLQVNFHEFYEIIHTLVRWISMALVNAVVVGGVSIVFYYAMKAVTNFRMANPGIVVFLPVAGCLIVVAYEKINPESAQGTNLVIESIQSNHHVPFYMWPLIAVSTVVTHLFGGSAGREGAALQIGASIGSKMGELFSLDDKDRHMMIMSGMSAAFSTLFGTPMAAAFFSIEMISVGIMHYSALVPCVVASMFARQLAIWAGVPAESFFLESVPHFGVSMAIRTGVMVFFCAGISVLFCVIMHNTMHLFQKIKNSYFRVVVGGVLIVALTYLVGSYDYNGAGINVIERCFEGGEIVFYACVLKMLFTAITLGSGFKGGEIVPSFFVGATFGCVIAGILGIPAPLGAAVGMVSVFCSVTNCAISSLLIGFELCGYEAMPYFLLAVAISYTASGYFGLYKSQRIVYSKYRSEYVNRSTR